MQPKLAALLQMTALAGAALTLQAQGCAAGTGDDDVPTGPVVAASSDATDASSATHGASTSPAATSSASGDGGGPGATSTSSDAASTSAASTSSASSSASSGGGGAGGCSGYSHTLAIDGTNDFSSDDDFTTSSVGYTGYVSWDATYVYLGMTGPDVGSASATKWMTAYIGGAGGTMNGVAYNTQAPLLPFAAKWHVRWKADNSFTHALVWNGATWADAGWSFTGDVVQTGSYIELRIPRADIGSPSMLYLHFDMLNEADGVESSYAAVPHNSFADGYDPDFTHYLAFDLASCDTPDSYIPL